MVLSQYSPPCFPNLVSMLKPMGLKISGSIILSTSKKAMGVKAAEGNLWNWGVSRKNKHLNYLKVNFKSSSSPDKCYSMLFFPFCHLLNPLFSFNMEK